MKVKLETKEKKTENKVMPPRRCVTSLLSDSTRGNRQSDAVNADLLS